MRLIWHGLQIFLLKILVSPDSGPAENKYGSDKAEASTNSSISITPYIFSSLNSLLEKAFCTGYFKNYEKKIHAENYAR